MYDLTMMIRLSADYLAAGANRHPAAADWDESGVLAFGADRNIAIWCPQVRCPLQESKWREKDRYTFQKP